MTTAELRKAGYTVTARKTGAKYPHYAPALGLGWEFVLTAPTQPDRTFSTYQAAWAFAQRLARMVAA